MDITSDGHDGNKTTSDKNEMNKRELKRFIDDISGNGEMTIAYTENEGIFRAFVKPAPRQMPKAPKTQLPTTRAITLED
jgi:hypothetical protein